MERRELFKILAATATAAQASGQQHEHVAAPLDLASYKPRFFTPREYDTLDRLCEIIIPADEQSPGAHDAQVRFYIDTLLHYSDAATKQRWRGGLQAVEDAARIAFGKPFLEGTARQQDAIVARMASKEAEPGDELERFFTPLKRMTIDDFHISEVGARRHLGYKGDLALSEFPGCTHAEHKA